MPVPSTIIPERSPAHGAAAGRGATVRALWRRGLALVGAVALHGVVLAALVVAVQGTAGTSGSVLEAIEVELVDGVVLAARDAAPANIITGALADVARTDGAAGAEGSVSPSAEQVAAVRASETPPEPVLDDAARLAEASVPSADRDPEPRPADASMTNAAAASAENSSGGPAARALEPSPSVASAAQVRATAGDLRAYAQSVSAALARSRPRGGAGNGVSRVVFTIDRDGGLAEVAVSRSSGNARLDTLALEAVRRARFAAPPAAFSVEDRTFEVPYTFR